MSNENKATVMMTVRFRSRLSKDELMARYPERIPQFRAQKGLVQKYYIYDESTRELGGVYLWDSRESMQAFLESDLRKTIASFYEVEGEPRVEILDVFEVLR